MQTGWRSAALLLVVAASCGCAATAQPDARTVPVYDATQVALERLAVVKRVGVGDWRSAVSMPGHPDIESARLAVVHEAARAGADGVVNLTCFDRTAGLLRHEGYFCYGNAVKLKN